MTYSDSFFESSLIETIRTQTDLVAVVSEYLSLKKAGQNFVGLCPFHTEKSPSFAVNPAKQFFHCFGCSVGGDVFSFVSKMEQIDFPETVRRLAKKAGVSIPTVGATHVSPSQKDQEIEQIYQINEEAALIFHRNLLDNKEAGLARSYLKERGISAEMINTFSIGFALPRGGVFQQFRNRIIFPIKTLSGRIAGFGGRALDDTGPKYLNTSETPVFTKGKNLFGLNLARGKKTLIVVEGYFDAISLHQAGITNVVATLGTALTGDHLHLIRRFAEKVTLLFDPDRAGVAAAVRAAPLFIENEVEAKVVSLPAGQDPDLFIRNQGKDAFAQKIESGELILSFVIRQAALNASDSISDKAKAILPLFSFIRKISNQVEQGYYLKEIADAFGITEKDVRTDFEQIKSIPQSGVVASLPSAPRVRLPEDEATLLALLIQDQLDVAVLSAIFPDDFTTPQVKSIVQYFWNAERELWFIPKSLVAQVSDDNKSLFSELAVLEILSENREAVIADCIKSLHKKRLKREIIKTQTQLKSLERGGDRVLAESLRHTFTNFKKELSQIS